MNNEGKRITCIFIIHFSFAVRILFFPLLPLKSRLQNDTLFAEKHTVFENMYLFASPKQFSEL
jgi:hypothetical protein